MVTKELIEYIKTCREQNVPDEQIRTTLKEQGWADEDISGGLSQISQPVEVSQSVKPIKPQKSQFWIWTTLWLTTILDSGLIFFVFVFVLAGIAQIIKVPAILLFLGLALRILALWLGVYIAVKYVLKKTIIFKRDAHKLALLAIIVPLLGSFAIAIFSALGSINIIADLFSALIVLGITYYSVRNLIKKFGSE